MSAASTVNCKMILHSALTGFSVNFIVEGKMPINYEITAHPEGEPSNEKVFSAVDICYGNFSNTVRAYLVDDDFYEYEYNEHTVLDLGEAGLDSEDLDGMKVASVEWCYYTCSYERENLDKQWPILCHIPGCRITEKTAASQYGRTYTKVRIDAVKEDRGLSVFTRAFLVRDIIRSLYEFGGQLKKEYTPCEAKSIIIGVLNKHLFNNSVFIAADHSEDSYIVAFWCGDTMIDCHYDFKEIIDNLFNNYYEYHKEFRSNLFKRGLVSSDPFDLPEAFVNGFTIDQSLEDLEKEFYSMADKITFLEFVEEKLSGNFKVTTAHYDEEYFI